MTVPTERTRAVLYTRKFLLRLIAPEETPRVPKAVRREALACLRHYPWDIEMALAAKKAPEIFGPGDL